MLNAIDKELLKQIANLHDIPQGLITLEKTVRLVVMLLKI